MGRISFGSRDNPRYVWVPHVLAQGQGLTCCGVNLEQQLYFLYWKYISATYSFINSQAIIELFFQTHLKIFGTNERFLFINYLVSTSKYSYTSRSHPLILVIHWYPLVVVNLASFCKLSGQWMRQWTVDATCWCKSTWK